MLECSRCTNRRIRTVIVKTCKTVPYRHLLLPLIVAVVVAVGVGCVQTVDYSAPKAALDPYKSAVANIIALLDQGKGSEAQALLDELQGAASEASALLAGVHFTGSTDTLTNPFTLPAGTYRAHLKTDGAPFVDEVLMASPDSPEHIFHLFSNDAVDGIATLYISSGERMMLQFSYVDAPYEFWFEKIE
jgi:hypothetical protein